MSESRFKATKKQKKIKSKTFNHVKTRGCN